MDSIYSTVPPQKWRGVTAKFVTWFLFHKRQIAQIGLGHFCYSVFNWFYDSVLYVFVVYQLGLIFGGIIMTAGSLIQCAVLLMAYQRMRIDWVGAAAIHSLVDKAKPSFVERTLVWAMRKGDVPIFLALCVYQDPFITTAYFKKGRFDALTSRDWQIFFASVAVSNGYWTLRSGLVAQIIVHVWGHFNKGA